MSESTNESESPAETSDQQGITDDQLPDDLNPETNPLAAPPDENEDGGIDASGQV